MFIEYIGDPAKFFTALRDYHDAKASEGINPEAHEDLAWNCQRQLTAIEKDAARIAKQRGEG